ncbi:kinesin-like protein KIF17 [Chiroxiphia lanceolata]|uniref:kinesin-like protein KIF17 n=1 Tax=Chiroxiphia lanceolata TaxID=296741 RepID=UPI0013CE6C9B|nr:kinesin-like protein KIF17 [Chiroxiphia lanceolata]
MGLTWHQAEHRAEHSTNHSTGHSYSNITDPLLQGVTKGYNGTIFAYGQREVIHHAGSRGSFLTEGDHSRAIEHILESTQCAGSAEFLGRASYLEICNETFWELTPSRSWRLQTLEVAVREKDENKNPKEKHEHQKRDVDEQRVQVMAAPQRSNEDSSEQVLLNVHDSIQEEV